MEVASVAGAAFTVAVVAAGLQREEGAVEALCQALASRDYLLAEGGVEEWPDGTLQSRYQFRHALYEKVLYARLGEAQQVLLHRRIGERLEKGYGRHIRHRANELAVHFERGRNASRAVWYRLQAAEMALDRYAYQAMSDHSTVGLRLLATLPTSPEQVQNEIALQFLRGLGMVLTKGFDTPEVGHSFRRAQEVGLRTWESPYSFSSFLLMLRVYMVRGELQTARHLGEQLLGWAQEINDPMAISMARRGLGHVMNIQGELAQSRHLLDLSVAADGAASPSDPLQPFEQEHRVFALANQSWVLWWLGYPDQALQRIQAALALAQERDDPFNLTHAQLYTASIHLFRREAHLAQVQAEVAYEIVCQYHFPRPEMFALTMQGAALILQHQDAAG